MICEDLARQEPVGEVIRGIGPTLLMALLSDGPQLKGRWSARYASVLADDPGTAVLSLTSKGMMERSKAEDPELNKHPKPVVGLWKDMIHSWAEFELPKESDAILFTISSKYRKEYTLDGRSDREFASVFQLDSQLPMGIEIQKIKIPTKPKTSSPPVIESSNLRELSAIQFVVDAIIDILVFEPRADLQKEKGNVMLSKDLVLRLLKGETTSRRNEPNIRDRIADIISKAWKDPHSIGISASAAKKSKDEMNATATIIEKIMSTMSARASEDTDRFYSALINLCRKELEQVSITFEHKQVYISILYNLYNRLVNWVPTSKSGAITGMSVSRAVALKSKIIGIIHQV